LATFPYELLRVFLLEGGSLSYLLLTLTNTHKLQQVLGILSTEASSALSFILSLAKTLVLMSPPFPQIPIPSALLLRLLLFKTTFPSVAVNDVLEVL